MKNSPRIPDSTRQRVLAAARELGYRPHPYQSTLMHTRRRGRVGQGSEVLAWVALSSPHERSKQWMPELESCLEQARQQAQSRGFRLETFEAPIDAVSTRRLGNILYNRGIKGVLLAPLQHPAATIDWQWNRFAVVTLGPSLHEPHVHRVRHHHFQAMLTAMEECRKLGYRRIGLALKEEVDRKLEHRWLACYRLKQQEGHARNAPQPFLAKTWSRERFLEWFETNKPDAVIAVNISDSERWLTGAGYRVPADVGLVSLSSPRKGSQSGIYQDWPMQGRRAITLLNTLLEDNVYGLQDHPHLLLVSGQWNPGTTIRPQHETRKISVP